MKKALILHGTNGNSKENWFPWLENELQKLGYDVWVPDLPDAREPNIRKYNEYIFDNKAWVFDEDTILIGHSSGTVAILGLLQKLEKRTKVGNCYMVGAFKNDLGWKNLTQLFETPFDFELIKSKAKRFYLIHSDDDPYCPLEHAKYLATMLNGTLTIEPGQKHFSVNTSGEKYREFPMLLELIKKTA